jgi:hypothetical protein
MQQVDPLRYKPVGDMAKEIREVFSVLIGQKLIGAQVFAEGTWHFYFGPWPLAADKNGTAAYLGIECSWRIHKHDTIIIGSEDYDVLEKSADRQVRTINALVSETGLVVDSVDADELGGVRIALAGSYVFDVFPASDSEMEWLFRCPSSYSLILMNGVLNKAAPQPG